MRVSMGRALAAVVLAAAIAGAIAGAVAALVLDNGDPAAAAVPAPDTPGASTSAEQIYLNDARSVVVITDRQTEIVRPTFFSPGVKERVGVLGSGFVVDSRGAIVTNDHVVQGATDIRVHFGAGASYPAEVVSTDPSSDLAVIRVTAPSSKLHPLVLADSSKVNVGDPVYAIGSPFGLEGTMTTGIVSATGRDIKAPDGRTIENAIQIDAPINHGSSGGPLLDRFGRVIGVNSQLVGGTVDANVGVGFAVPSATVRSLTDRLRSNG